MTARVPARGPRIAGLVVAGGEVRIAQLTALLDPALTHVQPRADGDCWHAKASEGEVVGAVEEARFQIRIGRIGAATCLGHALQIPFQRDPALAPRGDVAGRAIRAEHLDVQHGGGLVQRGERVRGVVAGPEQALLFGGQRHEVQRALRLRAGSEDAAQLQHGGHAGGVVDRTATDAVALGIGLADTESIPMRGEDHRFIGMRTARQLGHHVAGDHLLALELEVHRELRIAQGHRLEGRGHGAALLGLEIQARIAEQLLGQAALHPATHRHVLGQGLLAGAFDIKQRRGTRALHRGPAIRGGCGLVHDQHALRTAARGFFELVGPAAVVGHGLAIECARLVGLEIGVVDQHHGDLAVQVDVLVIVPVALGGIDAVADEHQRGVLDRHRILRPQALQGHVLAIDQGALLALLAQLRTHRAIDLRTHHRHRLHPAAIHAAGLQAVLLELFDQVLDGALFTGRGRGAALELVRGQDPHMSRQCLRIDAAAGQVIGGVGQAAHEQAGRQQQHAHRIHGRHQDGKQDTGV